jgi:hypothetical protein
MSASVQYPTWRALPIAAEVTSMQLGLRVPAPIELRWHVRSGAAPVPQDGSTIRIVLVRNAWQRAVAPPDRGVIRDGDLVVESWLVGEPLTAWAIAPDDAIALIGDPNYAGNPDTISFAPARRLTVTIRDAQGRAVRSALVTQMLEDRDEDRAFKLSSAERTDSNGVARFFPLLPARRAVLAARTAASIPTMRIGVADLTQGDVAIEGALAPTRAATLAFEIDGERRLPTRYRLRGPGGRAQREDAARGEVHLDLEDSGPPVPVILHVDAEGFCPCDATIPAATAETEPCVVVPLERGGTLVARILASPSAPPRPHLERLDAATGRFAPLSGSPDWIQSPNDGADRYEFTTLAPGRYRVADGLGLRSQLGRSYVASDAVDIATGATVFVELDLRRVNSVRVTFAVPEDENPSLARVVVVGNGDEAPWRSEQGVELPGIAPSGGSPGVELHVDETRALRVRAWHPWLVPASAGGEALVDGTHDTVVLVLERAPLLTFAVPQGIAPERQAFVAWIPVGGGAGGCAWAVQRDGRFQFGPPPIGTWDLLIDCYGPAPLRLRKVVFNGEARDLGELAFTRGSSLRIVAADSNSPLPPLYVRATTRGDPPCFRVSRPGRDGAPPVVNGLPAGIVDVIVSDADTGQIYASEAIEVDGVAPCDLPLRGK